MPSRKKKPKRSTKTRLRITGVVRAMNHARTRLENGIQSSEQDEFRQYIRAVTRGVQSICSQHGLELMDLPAPTYRAYQYLIALDLDDLPVLRGPSTREEKPRIRVVNLIATKDRFQEEFFRLAKERQKPGRPSGAEDKLFKEIHDLLENLEAEISKLPGGSEQLSAPSQRIYHWLKFVSQRDNFDSHLETLAYTSQQSQAEKMRRWISGRKRGPKDKAEIFIEFFNITYLYRIRPDRRGLRFTVCEAFIGAPQPVIAALFASITGSQKAKSLRTLRDYAQCEPFTRFVRALHLHHPVPPIGPQFQGLHYNLADIFQRINQAYFHGELPPPRLTWNRTITHRKLGHYQPATDTVMFSLTLDDPRVPVFVVDYVMFHELLHKKLGTNLVNGRRYAHTPEFRRAERRFKRYQEAQGFLRSLGENLQL